MTDQLGRVTKITYDSMWNQTCVTLPDGAQTHYRYDKNNRLAGIEDAAGNIVSYTYDGNGNRTGEKDPLGNTIRFTYDASGRLIRVKGEEGAEMSYAYDAEGHVTEAEDALGNKVFLEYDEAGQLVIERSTMGNSREYTYTALGKPESVIDEAGRKTSYAYLPGGLLSEVNHSDGTKESYTYDAAGNVKTYTDRNGFIVTYGYDCLGRVTSLEGSGGERKEYTYDAVGNVTKVTDVYGHATRYEYSLTGQLIKVTDALGNETEYSYDVCDRLVEIRQYGEEAGGTVSGPDGDLVRAEERNRANRTCHVTRYQRNLLGQVEVVTDALGNVERYTYDTKGQLLEKLDKEGYLTKYGYTAQGDVNRIAYADGREVKLSYNPLRQLKEMQDWLGVTKIENDAMGRALRVQYPDGKEVSYSYGKRTGLVYPDGRKVTYRYDSELRLSDLEDGNGTITYGYDNAGRLARKTFSGGMETSYAYDMAGRLSELTHRDREGILDRYSYQYDLIGNKTAIEKQRRGLDEESGIYTYGYDALGRLNAVAKNGGTLREYEYDAFGNRSLLREGGRETAYLYNVLNQLVSRADAVSEETYAYDKRGNLNLIMENGALKNRYTYGTLNRLEQTVNGKGETATYQYNGLGYRTGKCVRGSGPVPERQIQYTIDLTRQYYNLLQKEEGGMTQTYLWDGNVAGMTDGTEHRYYLQDDLGSPIRLLNGSGELTESYGYDEFGQDLYGNQGTVQPFGYTGYQHDGIAETYFAQMREYKPELGRFAGQDIIKGFVIAPYTLNEYGYCWGNPLKWVDINGKEPEDYKYIYYVNNQGAAGNQGHTAFLIVKENGMAEYYSYSTIQGDYLGKIFDSKTDDKEYEGRLYTNVKGNVQQDIPIDVFVREGHVDEHRYANGNWNGRGVKEDPDEFTRGIIIPISDEQGEKIHDAAQQLLYNPGVYNLWSNNCMQVATELIRAGGDDLVLSEDLSWLEEYPLTGAGMYSTMAFGSQFIPNQEYLLATMTAGYYGYEDIVIGKDGENIDDK
ncbi:MAG: hypothetical protein K2P64_01710 [Lachnospiraceae bacterium]|nr:hypothetical protein [Lachnospiraceae bacterium]